MSPDNRLTRIFFWSSMGLALLATAVHLRTFLTDREPLPMEIVIPLTVLVFPAWFWTIKVLRRRGIGSGADNFWSQALTNAPKWVPPALVLLFIYTGFNFFYCLFHLNEGATPGLSDGRFVLEDHGRVVRELGREDYWKHMAYQLRGMTTHVVLFATVSAAVLWSELRSAKWENVSPAR